MTTVATIAQMNSCDVHHEFKYKGEDITYNIHENHDVDKGQLISEAIFLSFKSPQKQTIFFKGFLP